MSKRTSRTNEQAAALKQWFVGVLESCDAIFQLPSTPAHREAAIQTVLTSNAKEIVHSPLEDDGSLYPAVCKLLAAACRKLDLEPTTDNWQAALENVISASATFTKDHDSVGLALGTAASVFKSLFDEALVNAGATDAPTILAEEDRRTALGLAINWGMRFLLAYAMELRQRKKRAGRLRDVWWIRDLVHGVQPD